MVWETFGSGSGRFRFQPVPVPSGSGSAGSFSPRPVRPVRFKNGSVSGSRVGSRASCSAPSDDRTTPSLFDRNVGLERRGSRAVLLSPTGGPDAKPHNKQEDNSLTVGTTIGF